MKSISDMSQEELLYRGEIFPDDPELSKMQNLVRYMRRMPIYQNWPKGMMLIGLSSELSGYITDLEIIDIVLFEESSKEALFDKFPDAKRIYFMPSTQLPETKEGMNHALRAFFNGNDPTKVLQYLLTHNWFIDKFDLKPWPKDSIAIVVCRIDDPYRLEVKDSQEINCWQCGEKCMICPKTYEKSCKIANSTIVCVQCTRAYYDKTGQKLLIKGE